MRVLLISAYFPPQKSVAAVRPNHWFKELPKHNVNIDVITLGNKNKSVIGDSNNTIYFVKNKKGNLRNNPNAWYTISRKFNSLLKLIFKWRVPYFDDYYNIYKEAEKRLKTSSYDLLIATGEPFILFKYAYHLNKKYNQPYILDYRDGWGSDHAKITGLHKLIRKFEKSYEKKFLNSALDYTVAALHIKNENNRIYNTNKGYVVENGVDLSTLKSLKSELTNDIFTITYTGSLYNEHDLQSFISAVDRLSENKNVLVQFVGVDIKPSSSLDRLKSYAKNRSFISIIPPVSYKDSLQFQLNSHLLLKFDFTGQSNGLLGAKLYEYAATQRRIITVLSIEDKRTTFFPNRNIQSLCYGKNEVYLALIDNYKEWKQESRLFSDISKTEINELSMESKINSFATWLKSYKK